MKTHLLVVTSGGGPHLSGADRDLVNLLNALDPQKYRATWICNGSPAALESVLKSEICPRRLQIRFPVFFWLVHDHAHQKRSLWLWTKILGRHALELWAAWRHLKRELGGEKFDLVLSNTASAHLGAVAARFSRRPHLWFVKEVLETEILAVRRLARFILAQSDAVVVPSRAVAEKFGACKKVRVVPDGSDRAQILAGIRKKRAEILRELDLPPETMLVGQCGIAHEWKGQHLTLQAANYLADCWAWPCALLFMGKAPADAYREKLAALEAQLPPNWRDLIRWREFAPDDFSFLAACDFVVHPSTLPDPLPNAVREALILGKPVIGARNGGIPDLIDDPKTGLLFPTNDVTALARAMERLMNQTEREKMAKAAFEAGKKWDAAQTLAGFEALFAELARR